LLDTNFAFFVGVDWGATSHQKCVLDAAGQPAAKFSATHGGDGLRGLCQRLLALAPAASAIAVAIESPSSPATEPLLQAGLAVFSLNPKQLDRFRDRYFPAGSKKDDRRDAFVLATSLRTDPPCFRRLQIEDPRLGELRALSRMHQTFKLDLVAYCNRLRDHLVAAWPELLSLCPAANEAWLWRLLEFAPSAPQGARLSLARLRSLLTRHRIRRFSPEELQRLLRQPALPLPASSFQRSAVQVQALLPVLLSLDAQQRQTMAMLENLLGQLAGEDAPGGRVARIATSTSFSPCQGWELWSAPRCWPRPTRPSPDEITMRCAPMPGWLRSPARAASPARLPCAAPAITLCAMRCITGAGSAPSTIRAPRRTTPSFASAATPMAGPCAVSPTACSRCSAPCCAPRPSSSPNAASLPLWPAGPRKPPWALDRKVGSPSRREHKRDARRRRAGARAHQCRREGGAGRRYGGRAGRRARCGSGSIPGENIFPWRKRASLLLLDRAGARDPFPCLGMC